MIYFGQGMFCVSATIWLFWLTKVLKTRFENMEYTIKMMFWCIMVNLSNLIIKLSK